MNVREAIYRLLELNGVAHTTLNPYGPGVVRIHLVPPKFSLRNKWSREFTLTRKTPNCSFEQFGVVRFKSMFFTTI